MTKSFYKVFPFRFVPFAKTPWAGNLISEIKKKYFPQHQDQIPPLVGESWEISTDSHFPSLITQDDGTLIGLDQILPLPLLLKWIHSNDLLSVQLHPRDDNPLLKQDECGKSEAWFVVDVQAHGFVYLGFQDGLSKEQITAHLQNNEAEKCLHRFKPEKFDCISVPPGCVHALGPGVFVAEPQTIVPGKSGKTWRISDWNRQYDGKPRELHLDQALDAIDWNLPRGKDLEKMLVQKITSGTPFYGNENNPFSMELFSKSGVFPYSHLKENSFSVVTVFSGKVTISLTNDQTQSISLLGGESAFIPASTGDMMVELEHHLEDPAVAFFSLTDHIP